jgi:uncharacterized membrane protein
MAAFIKRGVLAGAAGTAMLNAATYVDMVVRGRPASDTPQRSVGASLEWLGIDLPGDDEQRRSRLDALGALGGIASGIAIGVVASGLRAAGFRLPKLLGAVATGAGAMAATNLPMARAGISDPREWTAQDWMSDAIPHLAYGVAAHAVITAQEPPPGSAQAPRPPTAGLVFRSLALGTASGMRSSLGLAAPGLVRRTSGAVGTSARTLAVGSELVADKLPSTPSRLEPPALAARFASGATGSVVLSRSAGAAPAWPVLAGLAGAAAGSFGGAAWRRWAGSRRPDWQAALGEDAVAVGLAILACRNG